MGNTSRTSQGHNYRATHNFFANFSSAVVVIIFLNNAANLNGPFSTSRVAWKLKASVNFFIAKNF